MPYLQLSHMTRPNRFPKIFERARQLNPNAKKILSFGCSTGEECVALSTVFPKSKIVGFDITYYVVQEARRKHKEFTNVSFCENLKDHWDFDIVFCMMVLFSMEKVIDYDGYQKTVSLMERHMNPNGLLVIYTSQYALSKTPLAANFITIKEWDRTHNKNEKIYSNGYYRKKPLMLPYIKPKTESSVLNCW